MYDLKDAWTRNRVRRQQSRRSGSVKLGEQEKEYWTKAKLEDAVKLAQQNLAASKAVAAAAKDGQFDLALQAYTELQTSCRSCHDLHFEKRLTPTYP